ncbi:MAG: hypothetical protein UW55_C0012G0010 [Candidatus Giovannonibacteria bacterium GW2011_GWA2_44_26]|uniref:Uncharacterized protein n=1 Tax=Candidatus Giovannonibacteria bacterium GW2011_GWA2_44_26 TaxID=1618648 RepID=A0A0G1ITF9_9BACT|nr:MAG: hypothetical protein UW55_C0012G0010 [Candidatus Giovannonibacteria bacterium GW2011_GWA2_44_26]
MDNKNNSGADPNAKSETPSFDDAVGKEQPVNSVPSGTPSGDQPDKKPDAPAKPEDQSGVKPNDKSESPEGKAKSLTTSKPQARKTISFSQYSTRHWSSNRNWPNS